MIAPMPHALRRPVRQVVLALLCGSLANEARLLAAPTNPPTPAPARSVGPAKLELGPLPKAEFVDDPATTRDPFFPHSTRRAVRTPTATGSGTAPPPSASAGLALKGFLGSPTRPLALINNQTCAAGDEVFVKTPAGQVKVRCLEIRESSVVITVEGEPGRRELFLRPGL
jgi:hypothetical protein